MFPNVHANLLYLNWANAYFLTFMTDYYKRRFIDKNIGEYFKKGQLPTLLLHMYIE